MFLTADCIATHRLIYRYPSPDRISTPLYLIYTLLIHHTLPPCGYHHHITATSQPNQSLTSASKPNTNTQTHNTQHTTGMGDLPARAPPLLRAEPASPAVHVRNELQYRRVVLVLHACVPCILCPCVKFGESRVLFGSNLLFWCLVLFRWTRSPFFSLLGSTHFLGLCCLIPYLLEPPIPWT